ncbi:MAG: hypothetical protein HQ578_02015 [Chloroflexi bacterium]|nr:hypothetical protein [Chloroflexota bacterium]
MTEHSYEQIDELFTQLRLRLAVVRQSDPETAEELKGATHSARRLGRITSHRLAQAEKPRKRVRVEKETLENTGGK